GILGAGAGPEESLGLRALRGESLPARAAEEFLIFLVSELGVGDGDGAMETFEKSFGIADGGLQQGVDLGIDEGVNAADEETGDAGDLVDGLALGGAGFKSGDKGFGNFFVGGLREEQGDVDVQAFFEKLADGGDAFRSGGDFDHDVGGVGGLSEGGGFPHGAPGIVWGG